MDVNLEVFSLGLLDHVLGSPALAVPDRHKGVGVLRHLPIADRSR